MKMMDSLNADYPQNQLLKTFAVSRSSYVYHRRHRDKTDPERERLKAEVKSLHTQSRGAAGSRTMTGQMRQQGETIGRYKVRRLMKELGIVSKQPPGKHRYKVATAPSDIAPNHLDRQFEVDKPNQVWCGDVTYIWAKTQWVYLALVIDLYARRIVGWAVSDSPDSALTIQALIVAYYSRRCPQGVLFHSDQGCHYTSKAFRQCLWQYQMKQSMSRRGNCWDNAPMERCFRSFKTEWMPRAGYSNAEQTKADIMRYIKHYNVKRGHSHNHYLPPAIAEAKEV